jgi:hypothetical protein
MCRRWNLSPGSCAPLSDALPEALGQSDFLRPSQEPAALLPLRLALEHLLNIIHSKI